MNVGDYVTAREHLDKLLKQSPKADYVIYGMRRSGLPHRTRRGFPEAAR